MPTVPSYDETFRPVQLRPEQTVYNNTRTTADTFGGGIARAVAGLGQSMESASNSFKEAEHLDDVNAATDAENKFADWTREAMYGENGFMTLEGSNAVNARAQFEKDNEAKRAEFMGGLSAGAQKLYDQSSKARQDGTFNSVIQHTASERKTWFNQTSEARIESFAQDAIASGQDHEKTNASLQAGINELKHQSFMQGWSPEVFNLKKQKFVSGVTKNIVMQIAQNDPLGAEQYMKDAGGRLDAATRQELTRALKRPILAAKANRNVGEITGGLSVATYDEDGAMTFEPEASPDTTPDVRPAKGGIAEIDASEVKPRSTPRGGYGRAEDVSIDDRDVSVAVPGPRRVQGTQSFQQVAGALLGKSELSDSSAISHFIKNAAGINVNPATTPWCAGFANAVLGAQGIKGTGSLAARSFLNFGTATDNPKVGDIVVFGRGEGKGHVGFFQGYDAQGRILTLGGNQGKSGSVSISAQNPANLLGFRTAGTVDGKTMNLPNYNPKSLGQMQAKLDAITDPEERAATARALGAYMTSQKKLIDAQRKEVQDQANQQVMSDPTFDPMMLPAETQEALGPSGMSTLIDYQDKVRRHGEPITDDKTLYDLQTQFADSPDHFADVDLWQYRTKLSNQDWEKVNGWRQTARSDARKAKEQGADINGAFSQAREQLTAVGILKTPSTMSESDKQKVARFQNALAEELEGWKQANPGKKPTQTDTQGIINKMLLPIVIKTPGKWWDSTRNGLAFESQFMADGESATVDVDYEDIPVDFRARARAELTNSLGRVPSQAEIQAAYNRFVQSR